MMQNINTKNHSNFGKYTDQWKQYIDNCKKIIRITEKYIVVIDSDNNIDWETIDDSYDEKVISYCMITEQKPIDGLDEDIILRFKTIVGEAIVKCLESDADEATKILKIADEFRIDRVIEKSREWHLTFTILFSVILALITLFINTKYIPIWEELLPYINIGTWAIAGSCLSIILRSGNLRNACFAGKYLHIIESGSRLVGGFITGQIVYLGIKSGILFSSLINNNSGDMICLLALLAGASERFSPSIITKIDDSPVEITKES